MWRVHASLNSHRLLFLKVSGNKPELIERLLAFAGEHLLPLFVPQSQLSFKIDSTGNGSSSTTTTTTSFTPRRKQQSKAQLARAGVPTQTIDDSDVRTVKKTLNEYVRTGKLHKKSTLAIDRDFHLT